MVDSVVGISSETPNDKEYRIEFVIALVLMVVAVSRACFFVLSCGTEGETSSSTLMKSVENLIVSLFPSANLKQGTGYY